jgi:Ase1/PRC1/MAP65 family protein
MGMEPSQVISDVHPCLSFGEKSKNISDSILNMLNVTVQKLKEEKRLRMEKVIFKCFMSSFFVYTGY